jgi:uracil phosphoribosyltransferase
MEECIGIIRDKNTRPPDFRKNLRRLGRYLFYESAKNMKTQDHQIETPITVCNSKKLKNEVVIISILRASLPMVDGVFEELDNASLGVVSASRGSMIGQEGKEFEIQSDYMKLPPLEGKIAVLVDPMLATASTISFLLTQVKRQNPIKIVILCAIASEFGIKMVEQDFPEVEIYAAVVDKELNEKGYIVPGLGDAGDRACNTPH